MINLGRLILKGIRSGQRKFAHRRVLVIGDSHAKIFRNFRFLIGLPRIHFHITAKGGATASGLLTPTSKTQSYQRFRSALDSIPRDLVIVQLGEVDTGYVIWYRANKHQASVEEMFALAIQTYSAFLLEVAASGPVMVISAPLPTITDNNDWGDVAGLRRSVTTSQQQRTDLTLLFNRRMEEFCCNHGIDYLNLDSDCIGEDGIVHPYFIHSNPKNHHYHTGRYVRLLCKRLNAYFQTSPA